MKKKITALFLCVALAAIAIVGASLAYFTDTDAKDNVFTTGKVDITLNENFDQDNAKLLPGSSTVNNIKKQVSIGLEKDSEDSYVWYEWLIPAALDSTDGSTGLHNVIHVNSAGSTWDKYRENPKYWADGQTEALPLERTWDHDPEVELGSGVGPEGFVGTETIDGIVYNKYVVLYHGVLSNKEGGQTETTIAMSQVYMDSKVDTNAQGQYTINGDLIDYDFSDGVHIFVRAYAIQADGFADVYAAYKAYTK